MYSSFDIQIKTFKNNDDIHLIESAFNNIQQQFSHLKNIGKQFIDHVHKVKFGLNRYFILVGPNKMLI